MSLPIPNLDDRTFDDLMKEARSLIPRYNKEWTNYNPSDPGITLVELFSWLSEIIIYRINRVPEESYINFLKLIAGTLDKGDPEKLLKSSYLFNWNNFIPAGSNEIRLPDEIRLRDFLKTELDIDWADIGSISWINKETGKALLISFRKNWIEILIDESEEKGYLKINGYLTRFLHIEKKDGEMNLYSFPDLEDPYKKLLTFLKEIEGRKKKSLTEIKITEIKEAPVEYMESMYRVITSKDFEGKALECMKKLLQKDPPGRAICINNRKLVYSSGKYLVNEERPGHVSVIIVPLYVENSKYCQEEGKPTDLLSEEVKAYLNARRLITTRVHVVSPVYHKVELKVRVILKENTKENEVLLEAKRIIKEYFNPITGGPDKTGWPLGRNVHRSELYQLLEGISGVDHVKELWINGDAEITMVEVEKHQLIELPTGTEFAINNLKGTGTISSSGVDVTGSETKFTKELKAGVSIEAKGQTRKVIEIISDTALKVDIAFDPELPEDVLELEKVSYE